MNYKKPAAEWQKSLTALLIGLMLFGQMFAQAVAPAPASALSATEKEIADKITIASIKDATVALSAKEMEGRGTMQPGGDKAANWIADRFKQFGLKPLGRQLGVIHFEIGRIGRALRWDQCGCPIFIGDTEPA